jgi:hypothetical protein
MLLIGSLRCALAGLAFVAGTVAGTSSSSVSSAAPGRSVAPAAMLALLEVRSEFAPVRYQRSFFRHWVDVDGDCQDTRTEVLVRDDTSGTVHGCRARSGAWSSWLDGRSTTTASSFDVDHLVALAEAWSSGAHAWSPRQRQDFANDLGYQWSLQAVSASTNRSKSDRDPAEWLPSTAVRCEYAARWTAVKYRWSLSVDVREHAALTSLIDEHCDGRLFALPKQVEGLPSSRGSHPTPTSTTVPVAVGAPAPVHPGAFCSRPGAIGRSAKGAEYTCRSSMTDDRLRWRRP